MSSVSRRKIIFEKNKLATIKAQAPRFNTRTIKMVKMTNLWFSFETMCE